jgi:hypothetical protein
MSRIIKLLPIIICCVVGCSHIQENVKVVWGSSIKALEEERINGESHSFACAMETCFDQTLAVVKQASYNVFINNPTKNVIVVMGVPGSINTTEVGVFFESISDEETLIQVSSLSHRAMRVVATTVFDHFKKAYPALELDE